MIRLIALFLVAVVSFASPLGAWAGFIRIVPNMTESIDAAAQTVKIAITLKNEGDEGARETGVSFPTLSKGRTLSKNLEPSAQVQAEFLFSFSELKISMDGVYLVPFLIVYRDQNFYPFSSPQIVSLQLGETATRALTGQFDDLAQEGVIEISKKASLGLTAANALESPIRLTEIAAFAPNEIQARLTLPKLPTELASGSEVEVPVELKNASALAGSSYQAWIIIQGEAGGKHFAETFAFRANIVPPSQSLTGLMQAFIILLGALIVIFSAVKYLRGIGAQSSPQDPQR